MHDEFTLVMHLQNIICAAKEVIDELKSGGAIDKTAEELNAAAQRETQRLLGRMV